MPTEEETLQAILERLKKLDSIESTVTKIDGSVKDMNNKMDSFNFRLMVVESDCTYLKCRIAKVEETNTTVISLDEQYN